MGLYKQIVRGVQLSDTIDDVAKLKKQANKALDRNRIRDLGVDESLSLVVSILDSLERYLSIEKDSTYVTKEDNARMLQTLVSKLNHYTDKLEVELNVRNSKAVK